jgi:hypothetical protein
MLDYLDPLKIIRLTIIMLPTSITQGQRGIKPC